MRIISFLKLSKVQTSLLQDPSTAEAPLDRSDCCMQASARSSKSQKVTPLLVRLPHCELHFVSVRVENKIEIDEIKSANAARLIGSVRFRRLRRGVFGSRVLSVQWVGFGGSVRDSCVFCGFW